MRIVSLALFAIVAASGSARADRCAWIDRDQAVKGAQIIKDAGSISEYCIACGDKQPHRPTKVAALEVRLVGGGRFSAVYVNKKNVDLAYTYAPIKNASGLVEWRNVGAAAGTCEIGDQPPMLVRKK